jgi:guanine deaminase
MNQNCPEDLHSDEGRLDEDVAGLARDFGPRFILTDRFAVAVTSPLRRRAAALAGRFGLRMQTHLNEQLPEKRMVETQLYPGCSSYTDVYRCDGLLDREPILAHCVHMSDAEFDLLARTPSSIAHCPSSNTLLGSGIMPLARVKNHRIPYAICTDVGAGPTTSLLAEMVQFLKIHPGGRAGATGVEALRGVTAAPARMLHLEDACGPLRVGAAMSFIEVEPYPTDRIPADAESAVLDRLLGCRDELTAFAGNATLRKAMQRLAWNETTAQDLRHFEQDAAQSARRREHRVRRVTLQGKCLYARP